MTSSATGPSRPSRRWRSSSAARRVNVIARHSLGKDVQLGAEVGDAVGQRAGLAGTGAGDDQHRAARRRRGHPLQRVEPVEQAGADLLHPGEHRLERLVRRRLGGRVAAAAPTGRLLTAAVPLGDACRAPPPTGSRRGHRCGRGRRRTARRSSAGGAQLGRVEQPDDAVLAVVTRRCGARRPGAAGRSPRRAVRRRPG